MAEQTGEKQDVQNNEQKPEGSDKQDSNVVQIDRTEYDRLVEDAKEMGEYRDLAKDADMEFKDYFELLEDKKFKEFEAKVETETKTEKKEEAGTQSSDSTPAENEEITQLKTLLNQAQAQGNYNRVELDWLAFQAEQNALPEEERSPFTKKDVINLLAKPDGKLAVSIAGAHDNNIVKAANHILTVNKGVVKARQVGAEEERKKQTSATTSKLPTGGTTKTEHPETKEEKEKKEMDALLDDTCGKDDVPYEMPTER